MNYGFRIASPPLDAIAPFVEIEQAGGRGGGNPARPPGAKKTKGEGAGGSKILSILVVDDDIDFAESLSEILELEGHNLTIAFTGEDALGQLRSGSFDIAFIDIMLPSLSGVDVLRVISNLQPSTGIVLMTGANPQHSAQQAKMFGALDVLQKPINPVRLMQHLDAVIGKSSQR